MGEYFFGTGRGRIDDKLGRRIDAIARKHGATFVWVDMPGEGPRYWFACPNQGFPFDRATEQATLSAVSTYCRKRNVKLYVEVDLRGFCSPRKEG